MGEDNVRRWPSSDVLMGAIGYGVVVATLYIMLFGNAFAFAGANDDAAYASGLASLAAILLCVVASLWGSDWLTRLGTRKLLWPSSCILMAAYGAAAWASSAGLASEALSLGLRLVSGAAVGLLMVVWSDYVANQTKATLSMSFVIAFATMGVGMVSVTFLDPFSERIALAAATLLSAVFYMTISQGIKPSRFVSGKESADTLHLNMRSSVSYAITGLVIGNAICLLSRTMPLSYALLTLGFGVLGSVVVSCVLIKLKRGSWLLLGPVERFTFPGLIALLLVAPYSSGAWGVVLAVLLLTMLFVRDLARIVNRALLATEFECQSCYLYARTALPFFIGIGGGFALGVIANAAVFPVAEVVCSIVMVVFLSVGITVMPYGADPLTMPLAQLPEAPSDENRIGQGLWRRACESVAREEGLTPRECDIFQILSHGRSANVIARELDISVYTVKSHMYNIYRKLDIETQQDLIDRVEDERMRIKREVEEPHVRL